MQKQRVGGGPREKVKSRPGSRNKENPLSDSIFMIQNENEVLRMKNTELNVKIRELKSELHAHTDQIGLREQDIQQLRNTIRGLEYRQDIQIEGDKRMAVEKLALLKSNQEIIVRKIKEARQTTIAEQAKLGGVQEDRKILEREVLSMRAQNEGTKIVLRNLQTENERLRAQNEALVAKRKIWQPQERQFSGQIEDKIRLIKNQQQIIKYTRKNETAKIFGILLILLEKKRLKEIFILVERHALLTKLMRKKIYMLALIRKKYLQTVKNRVLQTLRNKFRPLPEQEQTRKIIAHTHQRRVKNIIWRKWRKAAVQAQFTTIRRFEFQNLIQKLAESFNKTKLYAAFNMIKYFRNNAIKEHACLKVNTIFNNVTRRVKNWFLSSLRAAQKQHGIDEQIQASSKEQTEMLVLSLYFGALGMLARTHKVSNRNLLYRTFKQLKKLIMLKRRRKLGEMLQLTNTKINQTDLLSKIFSDIRHKTVVSKLSYLSEEQKAMTEKAKAIFEELQQMKNEKKQLYQELALIKISRYLKRKMQKGFDIWRLRNRQKNVLRSILNLLESKKTFDINFAFNKIQQKRFARLKKSIADKIQSCQFSYNYLLQENKHIKQVLDKKTHELEKTKFLNILKKIIRSEKEIKLKYFYKFMKSGYKFWRFRKVFQRADQIIEKKVKIVLIFLIKQNYYQKIRKARIETICQKKDDQVARDLLSRGIDGFKFTVERNRRFRRVIGGIFQRNLQLDFYVAFGKIKHQQVLSNLQISQKKLDIIESQIKKNNAKAAQEEKVIETLTERLKGKEDIFRQRKILTLFLFFTRHIKEYAGYYFDKWRGKVKRENQVRKFATVLERKSRILLKNKFLVSISRKNEERQIGELKQKLAKYQGEYDKSYGQFQKAMGELQKKSAQMKEQNETNKREGAALEKRTDQMVEIKLKTHKRTRGKVFLGMMFRQWRKQTEKFIEKWTKIENTLNRNVKKQIFAFYTNTMKSQLLKAKLRRNLSRIYTKTYRANVGMSFRTWWLVALNGRLEKHEDHLKNQMKRFSGLENKCKMVVKRHNGQVDFRAGDIKKRRVLNFLRQYTQKKIFNSEKQAQFSRWLIRGYGSELFRLLSKIIQKPRILREKISLFHEKCNAKRQRAFYEYVRSLKGRRRTIVRLFINKFCPNQIYNLREQIFSRIKNFGKGREVVKKSSATYRIQKVIETFDKKRRYELSKYMRRWRHNQFLMAIQRGVLRRVTRNAMNWRVKDCFYSWRLEAEAKNVKIMHEEEGEVKKRKAEIKRIQQFLQDFKKQKGLLLQNQEGQLVVSPRFQEKKEKQVKNDNNMRYKFISRLILSMNGYSGPVKAWNNIKFYMLLREKYKTIGRMVKNRLRKPDLAFAFNIWLKATREFNKMFETMERRQLIKILNRQKDKMEIEYSKKVSLQDRIKEQMRFYKVLSHQEDRKQKLCAQILIKNAKKVKLYAFLTWRTRVDDSREAELASLDVQGSQRLTLLEDEVADLDQSERELRENNAKLQIAVREALQIAEMVKRISQQRDILSGLLTQKQFTCESLQQQNQELNSKLYLAQKEAMNLLILSGERL